MKFIKYTWLFSYFISAKGELWANKIKALLYTLNHTITQSKHIKPTAEKERDFFRPTVPTYFCEKLLPGKRIILAKLRLQLISFHGGREPNFDWGRWTEMTFFGEFVAGHWPKEYFGRKADWKKQKIKWAVGRKPNVPLRQKILTAHRNDILGFMPNSV